jgi:hypothetical protein
MLAPSTERAIDALDVAQFWQRGYAIIPGVYSLDEIEAFREAAYASRGYGGDLLANGRLRSVITDGRMVAVARRLLDTEDLFYGGDSSFTINGTQKGWHKDNADRVDPNAPDWADRYTQLRFGIYCQDHSEHTGGLNLRIGSHEMCNTTEGENLYVKTRPGDLAVWSMRITHSGNGMLLKDPAAPFPMPNEHGRFKPEEVAEADGDRIALFVHIGANDKHAERYCDYTKTRRYLVDAWRKRPYDDEARRAAKDAGLVLRDMPAEVMNDPQAGLNELWQPIPYEGQRTPPPATPPQPADATGYLGAKATATLRRAARAARGGAKGVRDGWRSGA